MVAITSYDEARYVLNFEAAALEAVTAGVVSQEEADVWLQSLRSSAAAGGFLASVTCLVVVAEKQAN